MLAGQLKKPSFSGVGEKIPNTLFQLAPLHIPSYGSIFKPKNKPFIKKELDHYNQKKRFSSALIF
ncbi:hypothetical protein LL947_06635 [Halomonas sp. BLK-85]